MKGALLACAMFTFLVIATLAHAVVNDPKPLQLTVSPAMAFAPADLAIRVRVHADPEQDRWLSVEMDDGVFKRRSDWTIEGDRVLYSFSWKRIPAGEYTIVASIGRGGQVRASDRATVILQ